MSSEQQCVLQPFLDRISRRSELLPVEVSDFLKMPVILRAVPARVDFVGIGERSTGASMVVEGLVGRFDQGRAGGRQITALHLPGDMPDLNSVVQPEAQSALQAISATTLATIEHRAIRALISKHPGLAQALWRDTVVDATILSKWVAVSRRSARMRVAHLICELAFRSPLVVSDQSLHFQLPMTQPQLGEALGLTSIHVNRTLKSLVEDGLLVRRKSVWITDWRALADVAEFEPDYLQLGSHERSSIS